MRGKHHQVGRNARTRRWIEPRYRQNSLHSSNSSAKTISILTFCLCRFTPLGSIDDYVATLPLPVLLFVIPQGSKRTSRSVAKKLLPLGIQSQYLSAT
jgi:hypothetical protein